jgi:hypothetical protein
MKEEGWFESLFGGFGDKPSMGETEGDEICLVGRVKGGLYLTPTFES